MDRREELTLNGLWVMPAGPVLYLNDDHSIYVELKNNTDNIIVVTRVACSFVTEDPFPEHTVSTCQPCTIPPKNTPMLKIQLYADLTLRAYTNNPTVEVEYEAAGSAPKVIVFAKRSIHHAIISPIPNHGRYFFISHKDPVNTKMAKQLDHYLKKIGFGGYIAEEDRQPGLDLWQEKILPSIENCMPHS